MNWFTFSVYLALVLGGFTAGYKVATWIETSKEVARLQAELDTVTADRDAAEAERQRADDLRAQRDAEILDIQERERVNDAQRHKMVPRVVADNSSCDLGPGAIELLNSAIRGSELPRATSGGKEGGRGIAGDIWIVPSPRLSP
jgi:hypothetical protein